ncbi:phage minor head protein [Arthrobacter sp. OY3WO11]|uniref:phage minor head protein n=1 Tax=Arthrobacter sp. OY3WO11 TaxID=1835723 RepID=UPI0007CF2EB2|nr:phage minor head protein [Arthrobacter sp. OY3WO11]OAE01867.1 hypothetical protein A6A22_10895 [Arthrobacter sp. OY3WO11]
MARSLYQDEDERELIGDAFHGIQTKLSNGYQSRFLMKARLHFDMQKVEVLENLPSFAEDKTLKRAPGSLFDKEASLKRLVAFFAPIYTDHVREAGQEAMLLVGLSGFDYEDPYVTDFITNRNGKVSRGIEDETDKQLRAELAAGLAEGESIDQLTARVEKVYGAAAGFRADRIARTETIRANNFASQAAWKQSDVVEAKEWFTAKDERVCPYCGPMDGKVVDLTGRYFNKGDEFQPDEADTPLKLNYEHIEGAFAF